MVILGRMQLFTEQTIVTVLPVMAEPSWPRLWATTRLWLIVFVANMVGTCVAAAMNAKLHLVSPELFRRCSRYQRRCCTRPRLTC